MGIRGDEFSDDQQYRILAMGGSTTACEHNEQTKSWPYIFQNQLNDLQILRVWVGNIGKPGLCTRERIMHMKYLLPQYPRIDMIIMLSGCIDLLRRLIEDTNYTPNFLDHYDAWEKKLIRGAFSETPYYKGQFRLKSGYYGESAIGVTFKKLREFYFIKRRIPERNPERMIAKLREYRKNANDIVDDLPDLTSALGEFRQNLNAIIDMANAKQIRLLFLTQPTMWKADMTEEEKDLLCLGWLGSMKSGRCYSPKALMDGMRQYNDVLISVCQLRGIEYIDLARILSNDATLFYDDCHFNDNGCTITASIISDYLSESEPFYKHHRQLKKKMSY
jgi:hypothetical protein